MRVSVGVIRAHAWIVWCSLFALAFAGCTLRLVASYDDIFDRLATDTHKKTAAFLLRMQDPASPTRKFANSRATYDEILADLQALRSRANANNIDNTNRQTLVQIQTVTDNIVELQQEHGRSPNGPSVAYIRRAKEIIDVQFDAITRFEAAKKRGDTKS